MLLIEIGHSHSQSAISLSKAVRKALVKPQTIVHCLTLIFYSQTPNIIAILIGEVIAAIAYPPARLPNPEPRG